MIKFTADNKNKEDGTMIGLGLSEENIKRLKAGRTIIIQLKEMGLPTNDEILIFYGQTEAIMKKALEKYIDQDTKISEDP